MHVRNHQKRQPTNRCGGRLGCASVEASFHRNRDFPRCFRQDSETLCFASDSSLGRSRRTERRSESTQLNMIFESLFLQARAKILCLKLQRSLRICSVSGSWKPLGDVAAQAAHGTGSSSGPLAHAAYPASPRNVRFTVFVNFMDLIDTAGCSGERAAQKELQSHPVSQKNTQKTQNTHLQSTYTHI